MTEKASTSQPSTDFGGGGTLSHVFINYPPLRCGIPGSKGLYYDDGNKLLLSVTSDQVFSWKTSPFDPLVAPDTDRINEGPILSVRYSLDAKFIAIQRSCDEIQFWHRETGDTFSQRCKPESESILGFFWTDYPHCDIVFVKTSGLDLFVYSSDLKQLRLVETKKLSVNWYVYTHESRLVLLATGMQCKTFIGFQLSSVGIIRLPKFEMAMAKSETNSKPVLKAEDVHIITVYGRIYCLQFDRVAMQLRSYRFYRDAVMQQDSLPIYSSKIAVSVVDNVLIVHQVDAKVVILYDIYSDSQAPISAPLPLLLRGHSRSSNSAIRTNVMGGEFLEANGMSNYETTIYGDDWNFLVPDLVCDITNGALWKIHLDLEAISASSSEVPLVLEFLQRRKLEASKAKQLCLHLMRTVILERRPVSTVSRAIDVLVSTYSQLGKTGSLNGIKVEKTTSSGEPCDGGNRSSSETQTSILNARGQAITQEFATGGETEPIHRSSVLSDSDPKEKTNNASGKTDSVDNQFAKGKALNESFLGGEGSSADTSNNNIINATVSEQEGTQLISPTVSPEEIYAFVFARVEEEMLGDPSYLVAIIIEFLRSASLEKIKVHPNLYVLSIQLLVHAERYPELVLFVMNKIIEPSREVALQLLESGRQHLQTRKLGMDMLKQLSLHQDYVSLLVQDGYYLEALRYTRKHKAAIVRPSFFLDAALASNDSQHIAAVLRFFSESIPGFKSTSDYSRYFRILNEMSSYVAA